jgi:hypothetical protein
MADQEVAQKGLKQAVLSLLLPDKLTSGQINGTGDFSNTGVPVLDEGGWVSGRDPQRSL